jgi:pimeloyl-ACP methyl ester carboxylesterase
MKKLFLINLFVYFGSFFSNAQTIADMYFPSSNITCIAKDKNNNIWVGTNRQGLWKYSKDSCWQQCPIIRNNLDTLDFSQYEIRSLSADTSSGIWVANNGYGFPEYLSSSIDYLPNNFDIAYRYKYPNGFPSRNTSCVSVSKNNEVWASFLPHYPQSTFLSPFASQAGGISRKNINVGTSFTNLSYTLPQGAFYDPSRYTGDARPVSTVACGENEIWVARDKYYFDNAKAQIVRYNHSGTVIGTYLMENIIPDIFGIVGSPVALHFDTRGNGWVGTNWGFAVLKNGVWSSINHTSMPTLTPGTINNNAIWSNHLGQVFIGTQNGLIIYDGVGLPTNPASYMRFYGGMDILGGCVDDNDNTWFATAYGIFKLGTPERITEILVYNVNEQDNTENYAASRRPMPTGGNPCLLTPLVKIAADGSKSTFFKIMGNSIAQYSVRIKGVGNSEPEKYGILSFLPNLPNIGDSIRILYKHPSYKDVNTPHLIEFEVYDTLTNIVEKTFKVTMKPVPVLFVHGLWSDGSAFEIMKNYLLSNGYDYYSLLNPSYPNYKHFAENAPSIPTYINFLKQRCYAFNLSVGKVDVVTHSMGGILTRLYLQNSAGLDYRKDINKFITINTPHSGSQAANLLVGSSFCFKTSTAGSESCYGLVNLFARFGGGGEWNNYQAVQDLRVNSAATRDLLNGANFLAHQNIVPSHLIVSTRDFPSIPGSLLLYRCKTPVCLLAQAAYAILCQNQNLNDCVQNNLFGGEQNDWIVALNSQKAGLTNGNATYTQFSHLNHIEIEKDLGVCTEIKNLLSFKNDNPKFNLTGFYPPTLPPPIRDQRGQNQSQAKMVTTIELSATTTGIVQTGSVINLTVTGSSDINTLVTMSGNDTLDIESNYYSSNTVTFQYTVPQNASGKIKFAVIGFGTTNVFDTLSIQLGSAIVLPITLSQFNGKTMDNTNYLQWQTATEINTQYFEVDRSVDAQNWFRLGKVKAAGNSQITQNYAFSDEKPNSKNYYRLKSVDNDGKSVFSSVIYLSNSKEYELEVFPVPSKQQVTIRYNTFESETAKVTIYDVVGKLCYTTDVAVDNTSSDYLIDISRLSKGVYFLNFTVNGRNLVSKIIKE